MYTEYALLFELEIKHDFLNGTGGLIPEPTPLCAGRLADNGLIFRKTAGGFSVLYECVKDPSGKRQFLRPLEDGTAFQFALMASSPFFLNSSELPLGGDAPFESIYIMDNLANNIQNGSLLLTSATGSPYMTGQDRIKLKPPVFEHAFATPNQSAQCEVIDSFGKTVIKKTLPASGGRARFPIDVRDHPPGRFRMKIDGAQAMDFYVDTWLSRKGVFGVVEIYNEAREAPRYRFIAPDGSPVKRAYAVKVGAREAFWRYKVVLRNRPSMNPSDLSITHPDATITFQMGAPAALSDGAKVVTFVSNKKLSMKPRAVKGINLKGPGAFKVENLPSPAVSAITSDAPGGDIFSDAFIYI